MPYTTQRRPNIYDELFGGAGQVLDAIGNRRIQEYQLRQGQQHFDAQQAQQRMENERQAAHDKQALLFQLAPLLKNPGAALGGAATSAGIPGAQFKNPEEEQQKVQMQDAYRQIGRQVLSTSDNYSQPGRIEQASLRPLAGMAPAQVNGFQYQPQGGGPTPQTVGGFPASVAPESELTAARRNNPLVADVRQERQIQANQDAAAEKAKALAQAADPKTFKNKADFIQKIIGNYTKDPEARVAGLPYLTQWAAEFWDSQIAGQKPALAPEQAAPLAPGGFQGALYGGDKLGLKPAGAMPQQFQPLPAAPGLAPNLDNILYPKGRFGDNRADALKTTADAAATRAAGYVRNVASLEDYRKNRNDIYKSLGDARNAIAKDRVRVQEKGVDFNNQNANARLQFQQGHDAWTHDVAAARLWLDYAKDDPSLKVRKQDLDTYQKELQSLEKEANNALLHGDQASYYRIKQGSDYYFGKIQELLQQPTRGAMSPPAITGVQRRGLTPSGPVSSQPSDAQREVRLRHIQDLRQRLGAEPSQKQINDITDAVARGLLK